MHLCNYLKTESSKPKLYYKRLLDMEDNIIMHGFRDINNKVKKRNLLVLSPENRLATPLLLYLAVKKNLQQVIDIVDVFVYYRKEEKSNDEVDEISVQNKVDRSRNNIRIGSLNVNTLIVIGSRRSMR